MIEGIWTNTKTDSTVDEDGDIALCNWDSLLAQELAHQSMDERGEGFISLTCYVERG